MFAWQISKNGSAMVGFRVHATGPFITRNIGNHEFYYRLHEAYLELKYLANHYHENVRYVHICYFRKNAQNRIHTLADFCKNHDYLKPDHLCVCL